MFNTLIYNQYKDRRAQANYLPGEWRNEHGFTSNRFQTDLVVKKENEDLGNVWMEYAVLWKIAMLKLE